MPGLRKGAPAGPSLEDEWIGPKAAADASGLPLATIYRMVSEKRPMSQSETGRIEVMRSQVNEIAQSRIVRFGVLKFLATACKLKKNSAQRRIRRAEILLGKPLEKFSPEEIKQTFFKGKGTPPGQS